MIVSGTISGLDMLLEQELQAAKIAGQSAMAEKFFELTRENFGSEGIDRRVEWPALSPKYAKRVKRDYATLFLSGDLESSLTWEGSNPEYAEVFSDNPYAMAHQFGNPSGNLPSRPFMPLTNVAEAENAELTDFAEAEVLKAAENAISERIK